LPVNILFFNKRNIIFNFCRFQFQCAGLQRTVNRARCPAGICSARAVNVSVVFMGGSIPPARVRLPRRQAGSPSRILRPVSDAVETARDRLFRIVSGEFRVRRGHPLPYGAAARRDGVNFSVFSKSIFGGSP